MKQRLRAIYTMVLATLFAGGLAACGQVESEPAPGNSSETNSAGQVGDNVDAGGDDAGDNCQTIQQTIHISQQSDLAEYEGMGCFDVQGHVFVQESDDIEDLEALDGLRSVTGFVGIADNTALTQVSLDNLQETGEGLVVEGNTSLADISFPSLTHVGHYLHVFNNQALSSASFERLFSVGDDVIFAGNNALTELDLPELTTVMGQFIFEHSESLECLCLPNLVMVNGDFKVHFNGALKSLSAPVLSTVWGDVVLERNPQLRHLNLECLERVVGDFDVLDNRQLAQCTIDDLVTNIAAVGGQTNTSGNASECPAEPVTAEDVGCEPCETSICVDDGDGGQTPTVPGDDDDDDGAGDDDDDDGEDPVVVPGDDDDDDDDGEDPVVVPGDDDDDDDDDGSGDDDDDDSSSVTIDSASLEDNPNSVLSTYLNLQTSQPTTVSVSATSNDHSFEIDFDDQARSDHRLALIGFRADTSYQLEVTAETAGGATATEQLTFQSGSLPADFAPIHVEVTDAQRDQSGFTVFNLNRWTPQIDNTWSYLVGVDSDGQVVWYYRPQNRAQDLNMLSNGNLIFNTSQSNIIEINLAGEVVNTWSAADVGVDYFHHEISELPNGNLVALASEMREISGYGENGDDTMSVVGDVVVEFNRQGQIVNRHSMFDVIDPHRWGVGGFWGGYWNARYSDQASSVRDWTHGNAVHYDPSDDSFLVSLRHQDWVLKIDRQTGELIWRLGAEGDFALANGGEWFYHQHDPHITDDGNIMLFDNGELRPGLQAGDYYSRAVEYSIDPTGANPDTGSQGTASQVWEYTAGPQFYSAFVSGVDQRPNGNVIIADGANSLDQTLSATDPNNLLYARVLEVTHDDNPQKVFEMTIRDYSGQYGYTMYRAHHVDLLEHAPAE